MLQVYILELWKGTGIRTPVYGKYTEQKKYTEYRKWGADKAVNRKND